MWQQHMVPCSFQFQVFTQPRPSSLRGWQTILNLIIEEPRVSLLGSLLRMLEGS